MSQTARITDPHRLLDLCVRLLALYDHARSRGVIPSDIAANAGSLLDEIVEQARDESLNAELVQSRATAAPFDYETRARFLQGLSTKDSLWNAEIADLANYGIDRSATNQLRVRSEKYFARRVRMARHPSQAGNVHPLSDHAPLTEVTQGLRTKECFSLGKDNGPSPLVRANGSARLTRRQAKERQALAACDQARLRAMILLLANFIKRLDPVFRLSYTLAVGQVCLERV